MIIRLFKFISDDFITVTIRGIPPMSLGEFEGHAHLCRRTGDPETQDQQDIQLLCEASASNAGEEITEQEGATK